MQAVQLEMDTMNKCRFCSNSTNGSEYCTAIATLRDLGIEYTPAGEVSSQATYTAPNLKGIFPKYHYDSLDKYAIDSSSTWSRAHLPDKEMWRYHQWLN